MATGDTSEMQFRAKINVENIQHTWTITTDPGRTILPVKNTEFSSIKPFLKATMFSLKNGSLIIITSIYTPLLGVPQGQIFEPMFLSLYLLPLEENLNTREIIFMLMTLDYNPRNWPYLMMIWSSSETYCQA